MSSLNPSLMANLINSLPYFMGNFNYQLFIQLGNCIFVPARLLGMEKLCLLAGVDAYLNICTPHIQACHLLTFIGQRER